MSAKSLIVSVLALSVPFAVLADGLLAVSDNYYSMLKVDTKAKETPLAVPFVAIAAATNQQPISVAEAVDTRSLAAGDMLMIYDRDNNQYNTYEINANGDWNAIQTVMVAEDGSVEQNVGDAASEMKVDPGYGSWLIRKNAEEPVILHGQLPYTAKIEVKKGKNLIGSTTLSPTDFNNCGIDWKTKGVKPTTFSRVNKVLTYAFGDSIMFTPRGETESRVIYYVKVGDGEPTWRSIGKKVETVMPAGCACWLIHKGEGFTYDAYASMENLQGSGQTEPEQDDEEGNE